MICVAFTFFSTIYVVTPALGFFFCSFSAAHAWDMKRRWQCFYFAAAAVVSVALLMAALVHTHIKARDACQTHTKKITKGDP